MRNVKSFEEFEQEGVARKVTPDPQRAKNLIFQAQRKLSTLNINIEKVGITPENATDYVEHCYDVIMFLLRAKLFLEGYNCSGQGAHEAEVAYTKHLSLGEKEILFLDQLRSYRNGILYYGKQLDIEYAQKVIVFTKKIYPQLKDKILL